MGKSSKRQGTKLDQYGGALTIEHLRLKGPFAALLHEAAQCGHLNHIPRHLISEENLNWRDDRGKTVVHLAAASGTLDHIGPISYKALTATDSYLVTPIHEAAANGTLNHVPNVAKTRDHDPKRSQWPYAAPHGGSQWAPGQSAHRLPHAGNLDILDKHGRSFLHLAAQRGCLQQVPRASLTQANLNLPDRSGVTPRASALMNGQAPLLSPRAGLVMEVG